MATAVKKDQYAQIGYLEATETAANTLTFANLSVFSNVMSNQAMILHRVEYYLPIATLQLLTAASDRIRFGLAGSDSMTTPTIDDAEVYNYQEECYLALGTPGTGIIRPMVVETSFNELPGGGLIVPADRIFLFVMGQSLGSAASIQCRWYFTLKQLGASDYLELAQSMRVLR
jgi:hypothetical protein